MGFLFIEKGVWILIGPIVETRIDDVEEISTFDSLNGEDLLFVEALDACMHFIG